MVSTVDGKIPSVPESLQRPELDLPSSGESGYHMLPLDENYPITQQAFLGSREAQRRLETCLSQISTCSSVQRSAGSNLNF